MTRYIPVILLPLLLGGCESLFAFGGDALDDLQIYRAEIYRLRADIRRLCWEITQDEVRSLIDKGNREAARALLVEAYPPLVSGDVVEAIRENEAPFSTPYGC